MSRDPSLTRLFADLRAGNADALNALFPLVYADLRSLARRHLRGERGTLHTTAVVHEAYLRFSQNAGVTPSDRAHFFAIAARAMRQIVVDHARRRLAKKRGGGAAHTLLEDAFLAIDDRAGELLDLHAALERMESLDERLGRVVELRFFAGLSVEEAAEALEVSPITIKRDWRKAKAFLYRELHGTE